MNTNRKVAVWDIWIRLFHWSLVVLFTVAWFTGEEENDLHIWAGYAILGLLVFRVVWGFVGSRHARFSDFIRPPGEVVAYLRGLASGRVRHYLGHNPAGGWMILALLLSLSVVTYSGLMVYAIEEGKGPLAWTVSTPAESHPAAGYREEWEEEDEAMELEQAGEYEEAGEDEEAEEFWEEIHEASVNFTLLLVFLHIAGVIVSSRLHRENLVRAMITGYKEPPEES